MLRLGTCSWKYDSWFGLAYSDTKSKNYLNEYSKKFDTVEIDQWFWSLFPPSKVVLPSKKLVEEYRNSVPDDFLFTIKVPNSITLTHFYKSNKKDDLKPNPFFLSVDLFNEFLSSISTMKNQIGCFIFQFEYLNKQKMESSSEFQFKFAEFYKHLEKKYPQLELRLEILITLTKNIIAFLKN